MRSKANSTARVATGYYGLRPKANEWVYSVAIGLLLTGILFLSWFLWPGVFSRLQIAFYDVQISMLEQRPPSTIPVIVDIDDRSIKAFGQWPWPRYRVASLLAKLVAAKVTAVGVDAIFAEPDRSSPEGVQRELAAVFGSKLSLASVPEYQRNYDKILARILGTGSFVLSYFFTFQEHIGQTCTPKTANVALLGASGTINLHSVHKASGALCSIPVLADAVTSSGFINSHPDEDGIYRRTPLIIEHDGRIFTSLALQTLMVAEGQRQLVVETLDRDLRLRLGSRIIPLDAAGNILIRFRGPGDTLKHLSAVDILAGKVDDKELQGRIVFVGISATGLQEYRPTPVDPVFAGVEFHATIVDNILQGDYLQRPYFVEPLELLAIPVVGIAFSILLAWVGPLAIVLTGIALITAIIGLAQVAMSGFGLVISPVPTVSLVLILMLIGSLFKYWREQQRANIIISQVVLSHEATIEGFGALAEYRDPETGGHIKRTQNYVKALGEQLRSHPIFGSYLDDVVIDLLYKAAPLHDIGKVGIPDSVLLKPGRLTAEEFIEMQRHPEIGASVMSVVESKVGSNEFLRIVHEIILYHQEKWDGSGYPEHLVGEAIPLSARLMAVADVYDALISRRVYKPPFPHSKAVRIITEGSGKHFDPEIVDAFLEVEHKFREIALNFLDSDEQRQALLQEED